MHLYYCVSNDDIVHYGIKRRSGRYPYGSGERPYQDQKYVYKNYKIKRTLKKVGTWLATNTPIIGQSYVAYKNIQYMTSPKTDSDFIKKDGPIEKLSDLKMKATDTGPEKDAKVVNSNYKSPGTTMNCTNCVAAFEMRRRGYDVKARRRLTGDTDIEVASWFNSKFSEIYKSPFRSTAYQENESENKYLKRMYNELCTEIEKEGNGSRGILSLPFTYGGGHVLNWIVEDNTVKLYDSQSNRSNINSIFDIVFMPEVTYARLDNLSLSEKITEHVVSVTHKRG